MLSNLENRDWNEILRADRTNFGSEDIEWFLFCWHRNRCRLMRIIGFHMPFFVCGFQHSSPWITDDDINQLSFLTWSTSRYRVLRDLPTFGHIPNKSRSLGDIGKAACSVTPLPTCPLKCFVAISLKNSRAKLTCIALSFPVTTPPKVGSCVVFYTGVLLLTLLVFYNLKSKSPCCPEEFEAVSTNFGGMMVHRQAAFFAPAVINWISEVFVGNHNLCHICWGFCNVSQSFDRVKSWMIDLVFNAVKQLLQHTPFPETHCENPEAEPYVGRDGTGKAFSLNLPSYRPEWQHLIGRPEMFHWFTSNLLPTCKN